MAKRRKRTTAKKVAGAWRRNRHKKSAKRRGAKSRPARPLPRKFATEVERAILGRSVFINPVRSSLRVGRAELSLTQREFQIVWCLVLHEGKWVSAEFLAQSVFGDANEATLAVMRVHISNLRQKVSHLSKHFQVEGARNSGYRITA